MNQHGKIFVTGLMAICLSMTSMSCKLGSKTTFLPLSGGGGGGLVSATAKIINGVTDAIHSINNYYVAYNNAGYGLAVWYAYSGFSGRYLYSVYNPSTNKWTAPQVIHKNITNPQVASNGTTFMVAFTYNGVICVKIWNGRSFSDPAIVSSGNTQCTLLSIASNGDSYCVAWHQYDTDKYNMHARVYNGTSWSTEVAVETDPGTPSYVQIASSAAGYCVTWYDSGPDRVYASVYTSSWTAPVEMGVGANINDYYQVAGNDAGQYMIVFGSSSSIYGALYNGTSWGAPVEIDDTGAGMDVAYEPGVASNGTTFCATWHQYDSSYYSIYARIFTTAWQAITPLESVDSWAYNPRVASDGSGYAVAWYQSDAGVDKAFANRYTTSWQGSVVLNPLCTAQTSGVNIYSNGAGYMASWREWYANTPYGTEYNLYTSAFDGSAWPAPVLADQQPRILYEHTIFPFPRGYFCWYTYFRDDFTNIMTAKYQNDEWKDPITPATGRIGSCLFPMQDGQQYAYRAGNDTVAVWRQYDHYQNGRNRLYASVKTGSTWGEPLLIEKELAGSGYSTASNGTSVCIVWYYNDGDKNRTVIMGRIYSNGAWTDAAVIDNDVNDLSSYDPYVAANPSTNDFCVIWRQWDTSYYRSYAAIHNTATGWGIPAQIDNNAGFNTNTRYVAAGGASRYCAVFYEDNHTYAAIFDGSAWTAAEQIHANIIYPDRYTMAGSDDSFAIVRNDSGNIYSKLHNGSSWSGWEVRDLSAPEWASSPGMTGDGNGNFCAVWSENPATGGTAVMASIYDAGSLSWGTPENAAAPGLLDFTNNAYAPRVASNGTGYAVVFYMQDINNINSVYASVHDGVSWLGLEAIEGSAIPMMGNLYEIASNGDGYGVLWWQYNIDATWMLYGSSYDGESWTSRPLSNGKSSIYEYYSSIIGTGTSYTAVWLQYDEDDDSAFNLWGNTFR